MHTKCSKTRNQVELESCKISYDYDKAVEGIIIERYCYNNIMPD